MIRAHAAHCPNCAAPLQFGSADVEITCGYCEVSLRLEREEVRCPLPKAPQRDKAPQPDALRQPEATLVTRDAERFTLRIIEQKCEGASLDLFRTKELDEGRFAIVALRCLNSEGKPIHLDLEPAWEAIAESLDDDGDPGLAANLGLEELGRDPQFHSLECAIVALDPARATALAYTAGTQNSAWWVSTEEARPITMSTNHRALETSALAQSGSAFTNGKAVSLCANDLVVVPSFSYLYDEAIRTNGPRILLESLREHLAEHPQRVVTLAKNAFWQARETSDAAGAPLSGHLRVAAVGARLVGEQTADDAPQIHALETRRFQVAAETGASPEPAARFQDWELYDDRRALLWIEGGETFEAAMHDLARDAVDAVLNKERHGDFDNPRAAGRAALAAIESAGGLDEALKMLVVHLSNEHGRVKFFARNWKRPIALGERGVRPFPEQMHFDEGGEVSLRPGERLFFPGALAYEGAKVLSAADFAGHWYGGKSSHLYEALRLHWRTRKTPKALKKLIQAKNADLRSPEPKSLALISGLS